jgi:uncharacterized iron-regulated membrane protein
MNTLRNMLFQIHLWTGLGLGLLFILLGLSGSLLVYPGLMAGGRAEVPAASSSGTPLPLEQIIAAARAIRPQYAGAAATVTLPQDGQAAGVRFAAARGPGFGGRGAGFGERRGEGRRGDGSGRGQAGGRRGGRGGGEGRGGRGGEAGGPQIFVDPVSGAVLGSLAPPAPSPLIGMAHQIHESMMLGRDGRTLVGALGIGMLFLGFSGLYLWWPKTGQRKYAFIVRPSARGARLYREIHGAFGIWFLVVFLIVTATGIPLAFPGLLGSGRPGGPGGPLPTTAPMQRLSVPQTIEVPDGAKALPLADLLAAAEKRTGLKTASMTVPARPDRPVAVTMARESEDGPPATASVNPYTGEATITARPVRPQRGGGLSIRGLHAGDGLGPVYRALVFASGFLPLLFVTTGFLMWWKKRRARQTVRAA